MAPPTAGVDAPTPPPTAPTPLPPAPVPAPITLRELLGRYLSEQADVLLAAGGSLAAGENVVHPARVAVRRLRSSLRVFGDLVDVPQAGHLEDELVWWAALLGVVRDLDVLEARLVAAVDALPRELVLGGVRSRVQAQIAAERTIAMSAVTDALGTARYARLLGLLQHWRDEPPLTDRADRPAGKIRGYLKTADQRVHRRLSVATKALDGGHPEAAELLHRARKSAKRHRYALEAAEPLLGAKGSRLVAERKRLQDVLGERQDAEVSAAFLRRMGAEVGVEAGHNGFTFGLLFAQERAADVGLRARLKPFLS